MDGMTPPDDGFEQQDAPHSEGNRIVANEVGDAESDNVLRERIGGVEDHGDGDHINYNASIENEETGESVELANDHIDV